MVQVGLDLNSSWLEWFTKSPPVNGRVLQGGANATLSWATITAAGPDNVYYMSDYSGDLQAAVDAAKGKVLIVDTDVTDHATLVGATYDYTKIFGIGRGVVTLTGDDANPVLDIRARGCEVRDLTVDADNTSADCIKWGSVAGDGLTAYESRASNLELLNSTTNALHITDQTYYCSFEHIRMQTGHAGKGIYFDDAAGGVGDNGQTLFSDCEISSHEACVSRNGAAATRSRITFLRCGFILSGAHAYAVDTYLMPGTCLINCDFEGASPTSAHLRMGSYSVAAINCLFSLGAGDNVCIEGHSTYGPYVTLGCDFGGTNAAATAFKGTCTFVGAESSCWTNWAGIHYDSAANTKRGPFAIRYYSQAAQPALVDNGEVVIWHDTDDNKIYLVARGNGGDKAHELP